MLKSEFAKRLEELIKAGDKLYQDIRKDTGKVMEAIERLRVMGRKPDNEK